MNKLLKLEFKKVGIPVLLTTIFTTVFIGIMTFTMYKSYSLEVNLQAWEIGTEFITVLFPLLVVTPTCWTMYYERKNKFLLYTLPRVSKKKYLISKWIVVVLSSFIIIFTSMFIGALIALYVNPPVISEVLTFDAITNEPISIQSLHVWGEIFVNKPILYSLLFSIWRSFIAMIIATMGFVLSIYSDNIFVILTGPFIYSVLENFILSVLKIPQYRLITSFDPTSLDSKIINIFSMGVGPILALMFIILITIYYKKIKKISIYKV